ncbi:class II aldolase/adducin family protein [Paraburkholderia caffeinilytica]|uniref:class II aldolase/adducin family protein n=1 Tax=Paraburkholderia caffeinilytica TaxID=1761016 RepID=UPI003D9FE817
MFDSEDLLKTCPATVELHEWSLRLQLAAFYRVYHFNGWTDEIFNHITVRVSDGQFLINPFGLNYNEVTARNLVKIDADGNVLDGSNWPVNRAGFVIHSAIHRARPDAHCVVHTHTTSGIAVACKENGLAFDNFYASFLYGRVAYHDFEGVTVRDDEQKRLVENLGDRSCLILRNHGLLVAQTDIANAYYMMYVLQRACDVQVAAASIPGFNIPLTKEACEVSINEGKSTDPEGDLYNKVFEAAARRAGVTLASLLG